MNDGTEASQLLRSGNIYLRRMGLKSNAGDLTFAGIKRGAFSIYFGDSPFFHGDLDGRWQRIYRIEHDAHTLKSLDGSAHVLERVRVGKELTLRRRRLSFEEVVEDDAWVRDQALTLLESIARHELEWLPPPAGAHALSLDEFGELLERISSWDAAAWFRSREAFLAAYGPSSAAFLSPTCAQPIILQATREPAARFGWLFDSDPAIERVPGDEFNAHCAQVARLIGRRIAQSGGLVLTGAHAMAAPFGEVRDWLEAAARQFPVACGVPNAPKGKPDRVEEPRLERFYAFTAAPPGWSTDEAAQLRARGLSHLDLGIASGNSHLASLHNGTTTAAWSATIHRLKQAGFTLGIVVVPECGGQAWAKAHLDDTVDWLRQQPLAAGDLVYIVDLDTDSAQFVAQACASRGLSPLDANSRAAQLKAFRDALLPLRAERGVKVVPYIMDKQSTL